jgi:hypothetical protein
MALEGIPGLAGMEARSLAAGMEARRAADIQGSILEDILEGILEADMQEERSFAEGMGEDKWVCKVLAMGTWAGTSMEVPTAVNMQVLKRKLAARLWAETAVQKRQSYSSRDCWNSPPIGARSCTKKATRRIFLAVSSFKTPC